VSTPLTGGFNHCINSKFKPFIPYPFAVILGWELQFLVPTSGTPIVSGIPIDSKDSGRKIFFEFRCLESQKIGIPIPKFGIPAPQKKTDAYSSIDTKVHGRKQSPYKMAGDYFSRQTYIYSHLTENKPTSTHT
jgi:hypothetical protein